MTNHITHDTSIKLCECGCGQPVTKSTNRFIIGHHNKVRKLRPVEDRFWEKVDKSDPNGCWLWTGCQDKHGYGYLRVGTGEDSKSERAYRISYELHYGPIPKGMSVLHKCDNPPCVRPDHLFDGTQADNMADCIEKDRHSPPPRNDVRGEKHGQATFTDQEVIDLRKEFAKADMSIAAFAKQHGTPMVTMWRIIRRKNYTHI